MRLGVYADLVYRADGGALSANRAFVKFVTSLPPRVGEVVLFGRLDPEPGSHPYRLPADGVRFVALPHYPSLTDLGGVARATRGSVAVLEAELDRLDAIWLFGPHPLSLAFARAARRRGVPVVLGVRQDLPQYIARRLPSRRWFWAVGAAHALERAFRRLARRAPTVAVGDELARHYARGDAPVLATGFSLITEAELADPARAHAKPWQDELRVLSVGRLDPEKNPLLLAEIARRLQRRDRRWRLVVVGEGPLQGELAARVAAIGLGSAVDLLGYVPNGPALWELYRSAHAFLHVSLTEGLPQVLYEAYAAGLPVVATDVGGVRAAVGEAGLLVPPDDADAAAAALERLRDDEELRGRLVDASLERARAETIEAQLDRIAAFLAASTRS